MCARLLDAEAVDGGAGPHVDSPTAERRGRMDFVAKIVHAQDLPLRRRLQDGDLAFDTREVHLAVGRHGRGVVLAKGVPASSFLQWTSGRRIDGSDDSSRLHQVQDILVDQRSGYVWQVLLEAPEDGGGVEPPSGACRTDGDGAIVSEGEIPRRVPFLLGDEIVTV